MDAFLSQVNDIIGAVINILWGSHTFIVLLGVGILFTIWSKFIQYRALTHGVDVIRGKYDDKRDPGAINHFQALSAALSATVGLGNIGGVALAIGIGGPGALFWMWVVGFLGMAIKSVEVTLSMLYRDTSNPDDPHGGAMWVIKRGLGDRVGGAARPIAWIIGAIFSITLLISTITGGNMFQAWNVADITNQYFGIPNIVTGIIMAVLVAMVIIGGIKRIGNVAGRLVPIMCGLYITASIVVLFVEAANVPALLVAIVKDAFAPSEAAGAFLGATAWFGLSTGLRRALFSNEAGQGSSPIAHSAAKTDEPVREGVVAGLEPFIDTIIVCTLTALVILVTGTWNRDAVGPYTGAIQLERIVTTTTNDAGEETSDISWTVNAPITIAELPVLPAPDSWERGNGLFLLADVTGNVDTNQNSGVVRITGAIAIAGQADLDPAPANLAAADREAHEARRAELAAAGLRANDKYIVWNDLTLGDNWRDAVTADTEVRLRDDLGIFRNFTGAALTGHAFDRAIPGLGKWLVTIAAWLFAISTMISWSYYGEQGMIFLAGARSILLYKLTFCALIIVATLPNFITTDTELSDLADLGTGCMLFANVPIIVIMAYQAMGAFRDYFGRMSRGEMEGPHAPPKITDVVEGKDVE